MTNEEKIDFIDDALSSVEDYTHGEDGLNITLSRKYLSEIKGQTLPIQNVVGQSEQLECDCTQTPFRYNELGTCKYCGKQKKEAL